MKKKEETHIKCQRITTVLILVAIDTNQRLTVLEQSCLQTDHDELHTRGSMVVDVVGNPGHVGVVKCCVNLIKHEERRRLVRVDGEEKGKSCHGLLASREMLHVTEPLEWRHGVILDTIQVGLVRVFDIQVPVHC